MEDPFAKLSIIHVEFSPSANSNPSGIISTMRTLVALDGPLLVTVIVNTTLSPTLGVALSTVFSIVKLTTGLTVT